MNPVGFPSMAAGNGGPADGMPQGVQRTSNPIQQQIYEALQSQSHPHGWQSTVAILERGGKVFQL